MKDMHYYEVAPNQIIRATSTSFTYASGEKLAIGQIVAVEVGKKNVVGIITQEVARPNYETKTISAVIEATPLPPALVALASWLSSYYATHLATVLQTVLPRGIQKTRRTQQKLAKTPVRARTKNVFTSEQTEAIQTIEEMSSGSALLHGVTGSGKTAVYIELSKRTLTKGQSVIVLVPEIALTSQLVEEFSHHFDNIVLTHSRQTEAERHKAWLEILDSDSPRVVIGPRSALFLPVKQLGLIVVDEAHEPSFKQEQSPRYSALRAASILATEHKAKLVLGSATPLVTDYYLAEASDRPIIHMTKRAQKGAVAPDIELVDMTKRVSFTRHRFLSNKLLIQLEETFAAGKQALIFHNRRGSASTTLCENCGWMAVCPRCFIPFTLHADIHQLRCHICDFTERVPTSCPMCHHADIIHKGIGTKLIESELRKLFPDKVIARFDGDSHAKETVEERYRDLYEGKIDLIVGTQVIAKGLDLPNLRTVGVVQADAGLSLPDFGASERTFQLLAQVVGRVGRSHHPTTVIVQSYQPAHPAVTYGLAQNYEAFYEITTPERRRALFPPFTYLLKLTCVYKTEAAAIKNAKKLADELRAQKIPNLQILGPTPAFYERQHDTYRWQLTLKSPKRATLLRVLDHLPPTHWQFELDPTSLL
jgi:primosomal protein N' (replication factor Y) (superfamily II helicase)